MTKECFKCHQLLPLDQFYVHRQMADGHLNKCKACTKSDVKQHRNDNLEKIRAYDRERGNRQTQDDVRQYRANNPEKYFTHYMVNDAKRTGKLIPQPCEACGEEPAHAHHDDYTRPLDVRWLCPAHHRQHHAQCRN